MQKWNPCKYLAAPHNTNHCPFAIQATLEHIEPCIAHIVLCEVHTSFVQYTGGILLLCSFNVSGNLISKPVDNDHDNVQTWERSCIILM